MIYIFIYIYIYIIHMDVLFQWNHLIFMLSVSKQPSLKSKLDKINTFQDIEMDMIYGIFADVLMTYFMKS